MERTAFISTMEATADLFEALARASERGPYQAGLLKNVRLMRRKVHLARLGFPLFILRLMPKPRPYDARLLYEISQLLQKLSVGMIDQSEFIDRFFQYLQMSPTEAPPEDLLEYLDLELSAYLSGRTALKVAANGLVSVIESEREGRASVQIVRGVP